MTDRREEDGYSVAPVRLGDGRPRVARWRRRLGLAVVILGSLGIVGLAIAGPRPNSRPSVDSAYDATPTAPGPTPAPSAGPSSLPFFDRPGGELIRGYLGVASDGFRVLNVGLGTVSQKIDVNPATDAIVPGPDGHSWTCICVLQLGAPEGGAAAKEIDVVHIASDGTETDREPVWRLDGGILPSNNQAFETDIDVAPDGRSALIAYARRNVSLGWDYSVLPIDLDSLTAGSPVGLGTQRPSTVAPQSTADASVGASSAPTSPSAVSVDSSVQVQIRRSPDGATAFVWGTETSDSGGFPTTAVSGWRVDLDAHGIPTRSARATGLSDVEPDCTGAGFAGAERFVSVCPMSSSDAADPRWRILELDRAGATVAQADLPESSSPFAGPLLDVANGVIWLWNLRDRTLYQVDANGLGLVALTVDPVRRLPEGMAPIADRPAVWGRARSSVPGSWFATGQLAGSPDGTRIYLLGYGDQGTMHEFSPSRGVFVVDPRTLSLQNHWPVDPVAADTISTVFGGSMVAVTGQPQLDADGNPVPWEASLTIHAADDGRVVERFGQLGEDTFPIVVP